MCQRMLNNHLSYKRATMTQQEPLTSTATALVLGLGLKDPPLCTLVIPLVSLCVLSSVPPMHH